MKLLLDTHTAIWFFNGDDRLSKRAKAAILAASNTKYLSIASAWEVAVKISIGKLEYKGSSKGFVELALSNGFEVVPIKPEHLKLVEGLPFEHRDPFDRLLVAVAAEERMAIVTTDPNISKYKVKVVW
ncbi:MAG: type II toxin-antitoxin system VapC family toxin [Clostridiales Family XIII bacterium]|jgi:PIN domain nuclease of toxin-antitoxin system|nr:type II toxin-antitoxin system VapC family toxin [Clostridiales Family XIII bacterium]